MSELAKTNNEFHRHLSLCEKMTGTVGVFTKLHLVALNTVARWRN